MWRGTTERERETPSSSAKPERTFNIKNRFTPYRPPPPPRRTAFIKPIGGSGVRLPFAPDRFTARGPVSDVRPASSSPSLYTQHAANTQQQQPQQQQKQPAPFYIILYTLQRPVSVRPSVRRHRARTPSICRAAPPPDRSESRTRYKVVITPLSILSSYVAGPIW